MRYSLLLAALLTPVVFLLAQNDPAPDGDPQAQRIRAHLLHQQGNWKEAYDLLKAISVDRAAPAEKVVADFRKAIECLQRLGRIDENDAYREQVIEAHAGNWRLLHAAAQNVRRDEHTGWIVAGEFQRGGKRGGVGGTRVASYERDRARAMQLMDTAARLITVDKTATANERAGFWFDLADFLLRDDWGDDAWRLQALTDLKAPLPDYSELSYYYGRRWGGRGGDRGAPVGADGNPVYHALPESWDNAQSDGQRWRWALAQAGATSKVAAQRAELQRAQFLWGQFGVQTMAYFGRGFDTAGDDKAGPFAVSGLGEDETIARLAVGIRRFKLPAEHNFIAILRAVAEQKDSDNEARQATRTLAEIFTNRQQYPTAAETWRKYIERFGDEEHVRNSLRQIVGNWGSFEPRQDSPAGVNPVLKLRFRNADSVKLEAWEMDREKLLASVKTYLTNPPGKLDWAQVNVSNIGYRIVENNQRQFLKGKVAEWTQALEPRARHFDRIVDVPVAIQKPGAYLITGELPDGNTSRIVLWITDTVIVRKTLDSGFLYYVADAATGAPVADAKLDFFGFNVKSEERHAQVERRELQLKTDAQGMAVHLPKEESNAFQWLVTASTGQGRLAWMGFDHIWFGRGRYHDYEYNQNRIFVMTDRPVYRPYQKVQFKAWLNRAQYDREGDSPFAGQNINVEIHNPRGEKVLVQAFQADNFGGVAGELQLPLDAQLGVYSIQFPHLGGGGSFRVEEYKKPEFEVSITPPAEPVALGEKIEAKLTAKYYFGSPVASGTVKYKVLRQEHSARWYPMDRWDWLFGSGYWWFAPDYAWYPGFAKWGCWAPEHPWWGWRPQPQPEVVAESEQPIGPDGELTITIDTAIAKAMQGDRDHRYEITAEVTDQSRRTIVGGGSVLATREPYRVYAWLHRGHYQAGDDVTAEFLAQTLDNKPVAGKGELKLLSISYDKDGKAVETPVQTWQVETDDQGQARQQFKAARAGQYRISLTVTDARQRKVEGGYLFNISGGEFASDSFRFNDLELIPDKRTYGPGEKVRLMLNTNQANATVLLFVRPSNGVYLAPKLIRMNGKSHVETIDVVKKDMPNFFVEAMTIGQARVHHEMRQIVVPPESRVLEVKLMPSASEYKPGEKAKLRFQLIDSNGEPFSGSVVLSMYDKAVEYISGGSNVPEIRKFFWEWKRSHSPNSEATLRYESNLQRSREMGMGFLGVFGYQSAHVKPRGEQGQAEELTLADGGGAGQGGGGGGGAFGAVLSSRLNGPPAPMAAMPAQDAMAKGSGGPDQPNVQPTVRSNFADTALWVASVTTGKDGFGEVELVMPENLTTWRTRLWAMGGGARVGEATVDVITRKNLIVRLQAPRFFVQKDEVVLSANVHNYLKTEKRVVVVLALDGGALAPLAGTVLEQVATIPAGGEKRVDWLVQAVAEGKATVRMSALTDEESDAMQMTFPVKVHGMLKTESFSRSLGRDQASAVLAMRVPTERRPEQSRLEIRYSPSLAMAMVDALPYLAEYPYGCTEQTLNRFVPTVVTRKTLLDMKLDLAAIRDKRANLNAQEIGDDQKRAAQWKRFDRNPVFDADELNKMIADGVQRLANQQVSDGGWGWFSGWGERSWPHTTAVVVHGLMLAKQSDVALPDGMLERGIAWLKRYEREQIELVRNAQAPPPTRSKPRADNLDAFIHSVLTEAGGDAADKAMTDFLYRDRNDLAVYGKAALGLVLHKQGDKERLAMVVRNIEQYLVQDAENQSAYLKLPESNHWWTWYGGEYEAMAWYLKLLARTEPKSEKASGLAKYLVNNRKHATWWNSTRDTAYCIEALAEYIRASGESLPDLEVEILVDQKSVKKVKIDAQNLFTYDNKVVIAGVDVKDGDRQVEIRKTGAGPLYVNAYLTNFTLEDPITRAGLEVKVNRAFYRLERVKAEQDVEGQRGQVLKQQVVKYTRQPIENLSLLKSGDLVEVELTVESKNDYEYLMFEDFKPAGFEPVDLQSGYTGNALGAYVEYRDDRASFFVRALPRGKSSVSYRLRAEIPGKFSALPATAAGMYAPELRGNSDEFKVRIAD